MIQQSSWPAGISSCGKQISQDRRGWKSLTSFAVASSLLVYSSHSLAFDGNSRANSRPPQDSAQQVSNPTEQRPAVFPYADVSQKDWASVLKLLVSGPERTELAAKVGELLGRGDLAAAQQMLSAAVEAGTLAIAIVDSIQDPEVQGTLQAIANEQQDLLRTTSASTGGAEADRARVGELGDAVERERRRAEAALQELHAAQEQLAASRVREARVVELERALNEEKLRAASSQQDLDNVREQLAAVMQEAKRAAGYKDEHAREAERAKAALLDLTVRLTAAHEQLAQVKGRASELAELREALEREKDVAAVAARELETLKGQLVALRASAVETTGAVSSMAREERRADAASQQLNVLQNQLSALQNNETRLQDELSQERGRSALTSRQLVAFQEEISTLKAQATNVAGIRDALRQEEEKTAAALRNVHALERQLAASGDKAGFLPAALLFQTNPIPPERLTHTFQKEAKPSGGANAGDDAPRRKDWQASLPPDVQIGRKFSDDATAQTRSRDLQRKSPTEKSVRPPAGSVRAGAASDPDAGVKPKRSPRQHAQERAATRPLSRDLPTSLMPADELWSFY